MRRLALLPALLCIAAALPPAMKQRLFARLDAALSTVQPDAEYAYLPPPEKQAIRAILKATLPGLPSTW